MEISNDSKISENYQLELRIVCRAKLFLLHRFLWLVFTLFSVSNRYCFHLIYLFVSCYSYLISEYSFFSTYIYVYLLVIFTPKKGLNLLKYLKANDLQNMKCQQKNLGPGKYGFPTFKGQNKKCNTKYVPTYPMKTIWKKTPILTQKSLRNNGKF